MDDLIHPVGASKPMDWLEQYVQCATESSNASDPTIQKAMQSALKVILTESKGGRVLFCEYQLAFQTLEVTPPFSMWRIFQPGPYRALLLLFKLEEKKSTP